MYHTHTLTRTLVLALLLAGVVSCSSAQKVAQQPQQPALGQFSMSLAVKDISAAYEFYQQLGFEHLEGAGSIADKWMILKNGTTKLGLFQGMFPTNTLTFNPSDARPIFRKVEAAKIPVTFSMGMDKAEGPCSFSISDPDGNPILVDQH